MLSADELERRSEDIISRLSSQTQEQLSRFREETNAQVDSIGVQISRLGVSLKRGKTTRGKTQPKEPTAPPPSTWEGFKIEHITWCEQHPETCDPFYFMWESEHEVKGSPIATFTTPNLWGNDFQLKLNLAFRVTAVNFRESPTEGVVQNQSIRVEAGYLDESGDFVALSETEMFKGDPNLSPEFFYQPSAPVQPKKKMRLFEPSVFLGVGWSPASNVGLLAGGSFVNLREGEIRLGANALINTEYFGIGPQLSYHPKLLGKNLNIAPSLNALYGADNHFTWGIGILFQVW